ncbi:MAG: hypothetical protein HKN89_05940 [Eudoraea sp.]|nr:hypothetical protein [Eudoraea sp.]
MYAKLLYTLSLFIILILSSSPKSNCAEVYTSASYGLSHSKKAFKAHNFDHQKYYAERALEALEKTRGQVEECGCDGAMNSIEDGIKHLEEAMDPVDWKMGRYHTKRAMEYTYSILDNLDICSTDNEVSSETTDTPESDSRSQNLEESDTVSAEVDQALAEFEQSAEQNLKELNEKIKELGFLMDCESNEFVLDQAEIEKSKEGMFTSIEEAQMFYRAQATKAYKRAVSALEKCGGMQ